MPEELKRLSSYSTRSWKRVGVGGMVVGAVMMSAGTVAAFFIFGKEALALVVVCWAWMGLGAFVNWRLGFTGLVDDVWDAGDALLVRTGEDEIRIPFSDIERVTHRWGAPPRARVVFRDAKGERRRLMFLIENWSYRRSGLVLRVKEIDDLARRAREASSG